MFILSFISRGLEFWSVNHTTVYESSKSKFFKITKFLGENILIIDQMIYCEQMYTRLLNYVDNHYWKYYNGLILLVISKRGTFAPFPSLVILLLVLPCNSIVSGTKSLS